MLERRAPGFRIDPRFLRQEVDYHGKAAPGTIIVDTPHHFLYLVEDGGKAMRYGIGVGRTGFTWSGVHQISAKKEWPDWMPPKEMLERQPYLPHFMAGGPNNPLGARALYIGSDALPHPRLERALDHRPQRLVRLHPHAQCRRHRSLRARRGRHQGRGARPNGSDRDYIPPPTINPTVERRLTRAYAQAGSASATPCAASTRGNASELK